MMGSAHRRVVRATALAGLFAGIAPAALAQAITTAPTPASGVSEEQALSLTARLDALERRNDELEAEVAKLRARVAAGEQVTQEAAHVQPTVALSNARPTIATPDGNFKFALRSVVQFDAARYRVDPRQTGNNLASGTTFRRARFGFDGTAYKDWNFALWGEWGGTGGETPTLNRAYLEYAGWRPFGLSEPLRLRVGAWATPAGLEDATDPTESLFLERAAVAEFVRSMAAGDGRTGVGAFARGGRWYAGAVFTGKVVGPPQTPEARQPEGYVLRAAFNPLHGSNYDVHLGASLNGILEPAPPLSLSTGPELRVSAVRLLGNLSVPEATGARALGLEAGASWNGVYTAAEWYRIAVERRVSGGMPSPFDPKFEGWYLQAGWTVTGERRAWSSASGGFTGIRPAQPFSPRTGGWGALELGARYSVLDLNDHPASPGHLAPVGGITAGVQKVSTLGVNWYPNSVLRFLLDYQFVRVNRVTEGGGQLDTQVNVVSLRSQFAF